MNQPLCRPFRAQDQRNAYPGRQQCSQNSHCFCPVAVHGRQKNLTQRRRGRRGNGDRPSRVEGREERSHRNEPAEYPISNTEYPISKERRKESRHSDAFPIRSPHETPREPSSLPHWQLAVGYSIWRFVLPPLGQNPVNAHPEISHCILLLSSSAALLRFCVMPFLKAVNGYSALAEMFAPCGRVSDRAANSDCNRRSLC